MNCSLFQTKTEALLNANSGLRTSSSSDERLALETHMVACKSCATDFQLALTIRDLYRKRYHYEEAPSATVERVHRAVEMEFATMVIEKKYPAEGLDWLR